VEKREKINLYANGAMLEAIFPSTSSSCFSRKMKFFNLSPKWKFLYA
jgi:hypothetical protein